MKFNTKKTIILGWGLWILVNFLIGYFGAVLVTNVMKKFDKYEIFSVKNEKGSGLEDVGT